MARDSTSREEAGGGNRGRRGWNGLGGGGVGMERGGEGGCGGREGGGVRREGVRGGLMTILLAKTLNLPAKICS